MNREGEDGPSPSRQVLTRAPAGRARALAERALDEGRLTALYQPVVSARDPSMVSFHEALMRIRTGRDTLLAPGQFLPALAGTAVSAALDRAMLSQALATLAAHPTARIAVNVGGAVLEDAAWFDILAAAPAEVAWRLIVEIGEARDTLDAPGCGAFVAACQARGVSVALDDFGAGATGFVHFRRLRFDIVKIDGSYGDGLARDPDARALVAALVDIARHFEMLTVVEHIDDPADARCAVELGADALQGYLFGRPCTAFSPASSGRRRASR